LHSHTVFDTEGSVNPPGISEISWLDMSVIIALLRGVNLGGQRQIKMDALRSLCESLKLENPQTCINSGNVVFKTASRDPAAVARRLEAVIEGSHGFRPDVIVRTAADLRELLARNPFAGRDGIDASKLLVTFLAAEPSAAASERVLALAAGPEEVRIMGRELLIYYPDGVGRSKLPMPKMEKALGVPGTARNWNTVGKLLGIAEKMEGRESRRG
jgi:uncharacterized protein (DUF1697 family)